MPLIMMSTAVSLAESEIEREVLFLPSDWSSAERATSGLGALCSCEAQLRTGEMNDAIGGLQQVVRYLGQLDRHKRNHSINSQALNTRSKATFDEGYIKKALLIESYNHARDCLITLGSIAKDNISYPVLSVRDTYLKEVVGLPGHRESKQSDGWIWQVKPLQGLGSDAWAQECKRCFLAYGSLLIRSVRGPCALVSS